MAILDRNQNNRIILRRSTMNSLSIDCCFNQVEEFICYIIPEYCHRAELINTIASQVYGLHHRVKHHGIDACQEELMNAVAVLEEFLNICDQLPAPIVFDVHTYIGQIKAAQKDKAGAVLSFTRALWIASSAEEISKDHIAATLHRMGQVYAKSGSNVVEARGILNKAIETYKEAGVSNHHVNDAKRLYEEVDQKYRESPESWTVLRSSAKARLAQILE